jgi:hypothetical protein
MGRVFFSTFFLVVLLGACSSGSGAGSPGTTQSGGGTCDAVCQKGINLHCSNIPTTISECTNECETEYSGDACASLGLGLSLCAIDAFGCDLLNGQLDAGALLEACPSQSSAYLGCQSCEPDSSDDACDTCEKTSCCAERKAVFTNPDMAKYTSCASACSDAACSQACIDQYPSLLQLTEAQIACTNSKCESACSATGDG